MISVDQPRIAKFVGDILDVDDWGEYAAIGMEKDGEIIGGVVFNNYKGIDVMMSCASTSPRWVTRELLHYVFAIPFLDMGCVRVTVLVKESNLHAQKFDEKIGFVREGLLRKGAGDENMIIYGMLKEECRYLEM